MALAGEDAVNTYTDAGLGLTITDEYNPAARLLWRAEAAYRAGEPIASALATASGGLATLGVMMAGDTDLSRALAQAGGMAGDAWDGTMQTLIDAGRFTQRTGDAIKTLGGPAVTAAMAIGSAGAKRSTTRAEGKFSITDWTGYPDEIVPRPGGPFEIVRGKAYENALRLKDYANRAYRRANYVPKGSEVHEIHPVKFGGSPTDTANKIMLAQADHKRVTSFWTTLKADVGGKQ